MEREYREEPSSSSSQIRRRRRTGRSMREKTPDPTKRRRSSEDESSMIDGSEGAAAQVVSMQIRPPQRTLSAHESKILRRRDKTFASAASRSHSQPREAEKLSEPEASELIRTVKRSLSMPRNKETESSEAEMMTRDRTLSPEARETVRQTVRQSKPQLEPVQSTADENLSRLEQNLRRFEEERKRFESEKRLFEREKRDHKMRYQQIIDNDERKRIMQSYRKLSDRIKLPQDAEERRRLVHSLRLDRHEVTLPATRAAHQRNRLSGGYEESSTQFSSSEAEMNDERSVKQMSPVRRHNSALASVSVRGPPPQPPARKSISRNNSLSPVRPDTRNDSLSPARTTVSRNNSLSPVRTAVSRNNSLSPVRPERRSKTPEQRAQIIRKHSHREHREREEQTKQDTTATEMDTDKEQRLRHRKTKRERSESLRHDDMPRKHSLDSEEMMKSKRKQCIESLDSVDSSSKQAKKISHEHEVVTIKSSPQKPRQGEEKENEAVSAKEVEKKPSFLRRLFGRFSKGNSPPPTTPEPAKETPKEQEELLPEPQKEAELPDKLLSFAFLRLFFSDARQQWRVMKSRHPQECDEIRKLRNKCFAHTIVLMLLVGFGGLMFRYTEGTSEDIYKCEVRKVKRDFVDHLWTNSHNMREEDWKTLARQKLRKFEEELHAMGAMGIRYFPGQRSWNFVNCILYCWTVITTIGYGHITPKTTLGQSLTIVYAIIGIPIFLILLADFGKLFTRIIKFMWGYVRRLYYTGTCRKIRKQQQYRDAMNGVSMMYDVAFRRPSQFFGITAESDVESQVSDVNRSSHPETPTSPYPETIVVDDEFNLPISLASLLLISYILVGAFVYTIWEDWTYMESFYFVFISMSTIGFGDLVPNHPIFMMCSIIYLVFGLALTSMFINVVQIKLSDTFKDASAKIGATIGLGLPSEMGEDESHGAKTPSDLASVHGSRLGKIDEDENELAPPPRPLTSILRNNRPTSPESQDELGSDLEVAPPPLLPRRQVSVESPPATDKKKKRRFFK